MDDVVKVTCPCCQTILVVDRHKGEVLEQRRPIVEESSGDRFEDAFTKVRKAKDVAEEKFEQAKLRERDKKARLEELFNKELKRVKDSGDVSRPQRDIDLD
jgi:hypothetical protein